MAEASLAVHSHNGTVEYEVDEPQVLIEQSNNGGMKIIAVAEDGSRRLVALHNGHWERLVPLRPDLEVTVSQ